MCRELRTRLKLKNIKEYLQHRRLKWFGHLEKWKRVLGLVHAEPSRLVVVSPGGDLGKTEWNAVIRGDLKKRKAR